MSTLINDLGIGATAAGTTNRHSVPTDVSSAKQVILASLQSSAGLARLTTQTGNASEVGCLALLAANTDEIGTSLAALLDATGVAGFVALTYESTWADLVTAIAAS